MPNEALYDPKVVRELFDEMSRTYGLMNILSSFGFTYWWRRRCLSELDRADDGLLRVPFLFYLNHIVPLLGRLFLGNPENYRMLGVYTTAFRDCDHAYSLFAAAGLEVKKRSYFFGCATGIVGCKPLDRSG